MSSDYRIGKSVGVPGNPLTYLDVAFSSAYTRRWHMVRSLRDQSLAEHAARVAYMFQWLLSEWSSYGCHGNADIRYGLIEGYGARMALCHDMAETLTGDMPSHVKVPAIKQALAQVEQEVEDAISGFNPMTVMREPDDYSEHFEWMIAAKLVKLADICETYLFALGNQGRGYATSDHKRSWILNSLQAGFEAYLSSLTESSAEGVDGPIFTTKFVQGVRAEFARHFGIQPQHL